MTSFSLRKKIFLSLLATTLLFALGMVLFAETVIYHKLHNKLREKGIALAKKTADDCINHVITERYFEIAMMFKDLTDSEDDIVYAFVLGEDMLVCLGQQREPLLRRAQRPLGPIESME